MSEESKGRAVPGGRIGRLGGMAITAGWGWTSTGYAENAAMAGFLAPGMQMITKPFPVDLLARKIRAMIEG